LVPTSLAYFLPTKQCSFEPPSSSSTDLIVSYFLRYDHIAHLERLGLNTSSTLICGLVAATSGYVVSFLLARGADLFIWHIAAYICTNRYAGCL
jgi:hypothetical protein